MNILDKTDLGIFVFCMISLFLNQLFQNLFIFTADSVVKCILDNFIIKQIVLIIFSGPLGSMSSGLF